MIHRSAFISKEDSPTLIKLLSDVLESSSDEQEVNTIVNSTSVIVFKYFIVFVLNSFLKKAPTRVSAKSSWYYINLVLKELLINRIVRGVNLNHV